MARRSDGPRLTEYRRLTLSIVMGLDQHRAQITAEWLDTDTGELSRRRVSPADRAGVRAFAARFAEQDLDVALEATTGWRFAAQELAAVGARGHLAEPAESPALRGTKRRAKPTALTRSIFVSCWPRAGCRSAGSRPSTCSSSARGC